MDSLRRFDSVVSLLSLLAVAVLFSGSVPLNPYTFIGGLLAVGFLLAHTIPNWEFPLERILDLLPARRKNGDVRQKQPRIGVPAVRTLCFPPVVLIRADNEVRLGNRWVPQLNGDALREAQARVRALDPDGLIGMSFLWVRAELDPNASAERASVSEFEETAARLPPGPEADFLGAVRPDMRKLAVACAGALHGTHSVEDVAIYALVIRDRFEAARSRLASVPVAIPENVPRPASVPAVPDSAPQPARHVARRRGRVGF